LVIGQQEQQRNTVNVRTRDNKVHGEVSVDEVIRRFADLAESKTNHAEEEFGSPSAAPVVSSSVSSTTEEKPSEPIDSSKYC
jgi:hypothetical protein